MDVHETRVFRISPDLRRCCWYVIVGITVVVFVSYRVADLAPPGPQKGVPCGLLSLLGLIALAATYPLHWRLRIDADGLSRRRLVWWDSWSWRSLASGHVEKRPSHTLYDVRRPRGRRCLRFDFLSPKDRRAVFKAINVHYKLPPAPAPVDHIRFRIAFGVDILFDVQGIHLTERTCICEYTWDEVELVYITRWDPVRYDFSSIEIFLPDRVVPSHRVRTQSNRPPIWHGATLAQVDHFFAHKVPAEKRAVAIEDEPLSHDRVITHRLEAAEHEHRTFALIIAIFGLAYIGLLAWVAYDEGLVKTCILGVFMLIPIAPALLLVRRDTRRRVATLRRRLAELGPARNE